LWAVVEEVQHFPQLQPLPAEAAEALQLNLLLA
jgi:hypothetical protein